MNKNIILIIGGLLILLGVLRPSLNSININPSNKPSVVNIESPTEENVIKECKDVTEILKSGSPADAIRLRDLYLDLATLIQLDGDDEVVKSTEEIRQANGLAGIMLKLDIKNKYANLGSEAKEVIVSVIGDELVMLNPELRNKAAYAFRSLAWACNESIK
jgi:hypothetical protein